MSDEMEVTSDNPSMRAQIDSLAVGESYSRASRLDGDTATKLQIGAVLRGFRQTMRPTAFRITQRTGKVFTIETGDFRTESRDMILCIVVTRLR